MSFHRASGTNPALRVSQNFLTCARTIQRLLNLTNLTDSDHVVEIGPGKGHITAALLARCGRVSAVELDGELFARLHRRFAGERRLELVHRDFLTWELPPAGTYKVFANIPFNRTTAIVRRLTEAPNPPEEAWLVVERGAAMRFQGRPGETLRSLSLKPYFDIETVHHFNRGDFHPRPSVDAVLLQLTRKPQPDVPVGRRGVYAGFVAACMNRGLPALARFMGPGRVAGALREAGVRPGANPGDILYIQWLCLYRWVEKVVRPK